MRPRLGLGLFLVVTLIVSFLSARSSILDGPVLVHGQVVSPVGPVHGAIVRWQTEDVAARTDHSGRFTLPFGRKHITAAREGFLIGGADSRQSFLTLRLLPLLTEDDPGYVWVDPAPNARDTHACGNCHGEIYDEWAASGHARSATNRHFRNLYEGTNWDGGPGIGWGLVNEHPDGVGVCASCHAPAIPEADAAFLDLRNLEGTARKGVHCDFCHKIAGPDSGTIGLTHGRYGLRLLRPAAGAQLFFGPLDDVDRGDDSYSPFYRDSRYCASCHEGVVFGVPVYSTYSEWLESPARREGKQCQDCHMTPTGRMTNLAPGHGGIERPANTLSNHRFFNGSRADMLRRSLRVSAELVAEIDGMRVRLQVTTEGAGHRVPTGFIDRNLILIVEGTDSGGKPMVPLDGPRLPGPAGRELVGKAGRLYAKLLQDQDGHSPVPFWSPAPNGTDTRLVPGRPDVLDFRFPPAVAQVRVRFLYRRFWQEVARLKGWPDRDLIVIDRVFAAAGVDVGPTVFL